MEALEVLQPGVLSTIQDLGRYGYQQYGVSVSGAMDKFALRVANLLVGNGEGEAGVEMTALGPRLRALADLTAAFTGGDFSPEINGGTAGMWKSLTLRKGDIVSFSPTAPERGFRAYMAVTGGIDVPLVMGSRSTHLLSKLGGLQRPLAKGDILQGRKVGKISGRRVLKSDQIPVYSKESIIRVVPGPQDDYFTPAGMRTFFSGEYEITTKADRMGYRLQGPKIEHKGGADILTDATPPGSIQIPGDGMPIILLADGQTSGGYSKIGVVISSDQDRLAQAQPGEKIKFERVDISQAYRILEQTEEKIKKIKKLIADGS